MPHTDTLPSWLIKGLVTNEPGGYKAEEAVINDCVDANPGMDRALVRQLIVSQVENKLLLRFGVRENRHLLDPAAIHLARVSPAELERLRYLATHLPKAGPGKLGLKDFAASLNSKLNVVYTFLNDLVKREVLAHHGRQSSTYSWLVDEVACYQPMSYTNGRRWTISELRGENIDQSSAIDNTAKQTSVNEPAEVDGCQQLASFIKQLEAKAEIRRALMTLKDALTRHQYLDEARANALAVIEDVCGQSLEATEAELVTMRAALSLWVKYHT